MRWIERIGWAGAGAITTSGIFWALGSLNVSGDFAANIAGATIGGLISVGLALFLFQQERRTATADAARIAAIERAKSISESLRYVRSIRECIFGGTIITINTAQRITGSINQASALAKAAFERYSIDGLCTANVNG